MKNNIGHQFRIGAGTATGTVSVRSVQKRGCGSVLDSESLLDLKIEEELIGVVAVAKVPERRPLHSGLWRGSKISVENELAIFYVLTRSSLS